MYSIYAKTTQIIVFSFNYSCLLTPLSFRLIIATYICSKLFSYPRNLTSSFKEITATVSIRTILYFFYTMKYYFFNVFHSNIPNDYLFSWKSFSILLCCQLSFLFVYLFSWKLFLCCKESNLCGINNYKHSWFGWIIKVLKPSLNKRTSGDFKHKIAVIYHQMYV